MKSLEDWWLFIVIEEDTTSFSLSSSLKRLITIDNNLPAFVSAAVEQFDTAGTIDGESVCSGVVSCADILAIAARDSIVELGGPTWTVQLGRRDARDASLSGANSRIPSPASSLSALITAFSNQGLSTMDMVALSGAHTIGQARCTTFITHVYNETNINSAFATSVKANCPRTGGDKHLSPLDNVQTPIAFDNNSYKNLRVQKGLLHSDQELFNGGFTNSLVTSYATNQNTFFRDFATAMVNMANIKPLTVTSGEVRRNCRKTN
ncbi:cationic peroxidase 1-like [Cryptomeria japonica]|uniref:cationic peroxidase 1-like n=1 Tax=Cryptomeria japonica TaxID=3369 RepID=UPI0027DA2F4A|nr:cationic peroxidase 1-like [Cryptomeria japonica]